MVFIVTSNYFPITDGGRARYVILSWPGRAVQQKPYEPFGG